MRVVQIPPMLPPLPPHPPQARPRRLLRLLPNPLLGHPLHHMPSLHQGPRLFRHVSGTCGKGHLDDAGRLHCEYGGCACVVVSGDVAVADDTAGDGPDEHVGQCGHDECDDDGAAYGEGVASGVLYWGEEVVSEYG